jgi:hypothetical protein
MAPPWLPVDRPTHLCYAAANCPTSMELIQVAARVLACVTLHHQRPDPDDVTRLRKAVEGEERCWEVDPLAVYIIEREARQRRAK